MSINEIMKPYFEQKEKIEKMYNANDELKIKLEKLSQQKIYLEQKLETIRDNKSSEILDYIQNDVLDNKDFYSGYSAMIRKDLEKEYLIKEAEISKNIEEINLNISEIEKQMDSNIEKGKKFYRVDIRELAEIKGELRKPLIAKRKELELDLRHINIKYDISMLNLSEFKYEYDENGKVLNSDEYKNILHESQELVDKQGKIKLELAEINKYLGITELTQEEGKILMMSMTPWEKEEYDRRKKEKDLISGITSKLEQALESEPTNEPVQESELTSEPEIVPEPEEFVENQTLVSSMEELIDIVTDEVLEIAKKLRTVTIEEKDVKYLSTKNINEKEHDFDGDIELSDKSINLPNGSYIYQKDIMKALKKYVKKNKGKTFKIKGINKTLEVNKKTLKSLKQTLKDYSAIKLLREKKISDFDVKKVYGKEKGNEYIELGKVSTKLPSGEYVNFDSLYSGLENLFIEKKQSWLKKLVSKYEMLSQSQIELDDLYYQYPEEEPQKVK